MSPSLNENSIKMDSSEAVSTTYGTAELSFGEQGLDEIVNVSNKAAAAVLHVDAPVFVNNYEVTKVNTTNSVQQTVVSSSEPIISAPAQPVVQNGVNLTTSASPSVGKSWASLFASKNPSPQQNGVHTNEANVKKVRASNVNQDANNVCPIKHPNKSTQFIDPDCYRMGEFLNTYVVDGKAASLQPRGLINHSNYCYMNSILQALIACGPLYNLLSGLAHNVSTNVKRKATPVIDGMCQFVKEFKCLPANQRVTYRKSDGKIQNTDIPLEPTCIHKMLRVIQSDLVAGRQEDAEEFLGCLLNGMNDEMHELIRLVKSDCDDTKEPTKDMRRTDFAKTPISEIFGGWLKSKIHRAGEHVTENVQPFFTLQLNIQKVKTVTEALEAFLSKTELKGVTSTKTNKEVQAWQQVMLEELPVVLVLHLKCFDFKLNRCTKIIKALEFPFDLKIEEKLLSSPKKEKQYKLFAVVYHDGIEASKGHYFTDAFHVRYSSWLRYNDSSVKAIPKEQVLRPQGTTVPYLLFYRRCDTIKNK